MEIRVRLIRETHRRDTEPFLWETTLREYPEPDGRQPIEIALLSPERSKVEGTTGFNGHTVYRVAITRTSSEAEKKVSAPLN